MASVSKQKKLPWWHWVIAGIVGIGIIGLIIVWSMDQLAMFEQQRVTNTIVNQKLASVSAELINLRNEDQYKRNNALQADIKEIEKTYTLAVGAYEELLDLQIIAKDPSASSGQGTKKFDEGFADILDLLSKRNYASASSQLVTLRSEIKKEQQKIAAAFVIPANVSQSNAPPGSGFSRQSVTADIGTYLVDIVAADMGSTRIIVDTASDGTCTNDCPTKPLAEYVSRSGAFAGINGSYFCPAEYPSCAGKKNSFDTLLMNKSKVYFNSENNVYSTIPAVIFQSGSMRFVGRSLDWGRDTGVDGVLANQPLLLSGGNITFGGGSDPKQGSKGSRSFVGNKGSMAYIGVVHNATVAEVAHVLKALGLEGALNLDSGGSTALWSAGYKVGPGRNIPNAILFVKK